MTTGTVIELTTHIIDISYHNQLSISNINHISASDTLIRRAVLENAERRHEEHERDYANRHDARDDKERRLRTGKILIEKIYNRQLLVMPD